VVTPIIEVTDITLNPQILSLDQDQTYQLTVTVTPNNATNYNVTWSSDDTSIATVDANGLVTAVAEGTTTITATIGNVTATCEVTTLTSINSIDETPSVTVYPNPVAGQYVYVKLNALSNVQKLEIFDVTGKLVFVNAELTQNEFSIDVSGYNSGIYIFKIQN
jgi:hypothetical protein